MRAYIIRRLILIIPTLLIVTIVVFFVIRLLPGDILQIMADEQSFQSEKTVEIIKHELGLDVPIHVQYGRWIWGLLRGDLGNSLWTERPVVDTLMKKLPVSFELGVLALIIGLLLAIPIGIISAVRQDSIGDYIGRAIAITFISLPSFWVGTLVMVLPSIWWHWSPPMEYKSFFENPSQNIVMFIIPATILGMLMSGVIMRMTRTMMLEVLRQDYIRTAWAKGLKERVVIIRHALKNAMIPIVTIVGLRAPVLIGGSVILENIFNLPGIGRLLINRIWDRDYTILSGINLMIATMIMFINLVVDVVYAYLDPRVQYR